MLKWPGGKRNLLQELLARIPSHYGTYYEPFVGGGALFFALQPKAAILGDENSELISFYRQLRLNCADILAATARLKNDRETFYKIRGAEPTNAIGRAVRLLYLNRTCFNGIYRTNRVGLFNVPFGNNGRKTVGDITNFKRAALSLKRAKLLDEDFEETCRSVVAGDLVYFDPPYTVAHENNGFLKYNAAIFTWQDQIRLHRVAKELTKRGALMLLSNANHNSLHTLYKGFRQQVVQRHSRLSAKISGRRLVRELIISNF